ncbi:GNAT family N-acetyltransferase [Nocardioides marmoribigeumensis]|uniref:Acetyltransferase n=1 Tax=Nocardioides marmoribigeumensis TaxID=433649 RepID=A0ABU2BTI5_9ACTN|nr:GNAT family N-acetyltransferase [Nocardioides marmoribigeumensis]MDR7361940.1 putative acetyltransferase [Nocardioides marmoribigeumensis]
MPELVVPRPSLHSPFLEALAEYAAAGDYPHGSGITPDHLPLDEVRGEPWFAGDLADPERFAAYAEAMPRLADGDVARGFAMVPDTKRWITERDQVLGFLSVRHELNDFRLEEGGHIGYSVRPSARRRGLATYACAWGLDHLRSLGVDRALITCDDDNEASAATILRNGGVLEDVRHGKRRYWVDLRA